MTIGATCLDCGQHFPEEHLRLFRGARTVWLCRSCAVSHFTPRERFTWMLAQTRDVMAQQIASLHALGPRQFGMPNGTVQVDYDNRALLGGHVVANECVHMVLAVFAPDAFWTMRVGTQQLSRSLGSIVLADPVIAFPGASLDVDGAESLVVATMWKR